MLLLFDICLCHRCTSFFFFFNFFVVLIVDGNLQLIKDFDTTGQYIVFVGVISAFLFVVGSFVYYKKKVQGVADSVRYLAIGKFFLQLSDLFTDIFFNVILYLENRMAILTYISISSLSISYFGSICICVLWLVRWKGWQDHVAERLHNYLNSYASLLIGLTILSNFYVAVDLLRSKLFYHKAFYFPLTKYEYEKLNRYRFVNITLCENFTQFVVQIVYLMNHDLSQVNSIIFLSVIFSVFSIFFSLMKCCVNDGQSQTKLSLENKFGEKLVIDGNFTIECEKFLYFHAFSHNKIGQCLKHFLNTEMDLSIGGITTIRRNDISLSCEVYYIENIIHLQNQLKVYFLVQVLHFKNDLRLANGIYNIISLLIDASGDDTNALIERYGTVTILQNKTSTDSRKFQLHSKSNSTLIQMSNVSSFDANSKRVSATSSGRASIHISGSGGVSQDPLSVDHAGDVIIHDDHDVDDGGVSESVDIIITLSPNGKTKFLKMIEKALKISKSNGVKFVNTGSGNMNGNKLKRSSSQDHNQGKSIATPKLLTKVRSSIAAHNNSNDEKYLADNKDDDNKDVPNILIP